MFISASRVAAVETLVSFDRSEYSAALRLPAFPAQT
jgi:hypothetical protein